MSSNRTPILEIWRQATRTEAAAGVFLVLVAVCGCFATTGALQTASRLTYSFARDDALIGASQLRRVHSSLGVPVWALCANAVAVALIGFIYLGSTNAFNSIVSSGIILQHLSFGFPAALLLYNCRSEEFLPQKRTFKLDRLGLGWVANTLTVLLAVVALVFYCFPVEMPVSVENMSKLFSTSLQFFCLFLLYS